MLYLIYFYLALITLASGFFSDVYRVRLTNLMIVTNFDKPFRLYLG